MPLCPGVAMVMAVEDSMLRVVVRLRPPTPKELEVSGGLWFRW